MTSESEGRGPLADLIVLDPYVDTELAAYFKMHTSLGQGDVEKVVVDVMAIIRGERTGRG